MIAVDLLLIEDSDDDAFLIAKELERGGYAVTSHRVETRDELCAALPLKQWHLVISDFGLPGFSGGEALAIVRAHDHDVPFILVSGTIGEETAVDLIRAGASDYVLKDRLQRLLPAVRRELRDAAVRKERSALAEEVVREKERFSATFHHAPIGIANGSSAGVLLRVNERFCQLLGYTSEELLGRSIWALSHPDDLEFGRERHARLMSGSQSTDTFERRFYRKDGSVMWANVTLAVVKDAHGEIDHVIGLVEDISRRHAADQALRESRAQLAMAQQFIRVGSVEQDLVTGRRVWSDAMFGILGLEVASEPPRTEELFPLVDEEDRERVKLLVERAVTEFQPYTTDYKITLGDGRRCEMRSHASIIADASGRPAKLLTVVQDITEQKILERELSARAKQQSAIAALGSRAVGGVDGEIIDHACTLLREVLEADHSFLLELDVEKQRFTPCGGNVWGSLPDFVIPSTIDSQAGYTLHVDEPVVVVDYATEPRFKRAAIIASHGMVSGITVPIRVDGEAFGVLGVHTRSRRCFADGDVHFVQALANIVADVIQRDRNSRALLDSEARYRSVSRELHLLLQSAEEGVCAVRTDGTCRVVNPAAARLLGYEPEELIGQNLHELVHSRRRDGTIYPMEECPILLAAKDGQSRRQMNDTFWRRDGSQLAIEYAAAPIIDDGVITGVVVTFTDMSERRKMEARLEQATRLNSLGHLAATMAHEFNNVLMGISPFLELLNRAEDPSAILKTATEQMAKAVQRGKGVTGEILRFTRSRPPALEMIDVEDWLRTLTTEVTSMLGSDHQLQLIVDSPALRMSADGNLLHQSLLNLIVNARDAMPDGGPITISVRHDDASARYPFGAVPDPDRFIHFAVSDKGCGMTAETVSHIFEPLFTTKRNGTGLGLAVTHQVIERHGGHIFVESTIGEGTTFHLFVPIAAGRDLAAPAPLPIPAVRRAGGKVLLVEDEEAVSSGVAVLLEMEAIAAIPVRTGAEVTDAVRVHRPDAVILDIGLPDADGTVIYEALADSYPNLPVIFSTGHGDEQKLEPFLNRDNVRFLMKPYEFSALLDMLASVGIASGA